MYGRALCTTPFHQDWKISAETPASGYEKAALILTADERAAADLRAILKECKLDAVRLHSVGELRMGALDETTALLLCEEVLPDGDFRDALRVVASAARRIPVLVFSRIADWDTYLRAMRLGAYDCLRFPFRSGELQRIVRQIVRVPRQQASGSRAHHGIG